MATRKVTSTGATVTITSAAAAPTNKVAKASKAPKAVTVASPLPTVATPAVVAPAPAAAPVPVVAQRGGPVVQAIALGDKVYRVKAEHNLAAWRALEQLMAGHAAPMPVVLETLKAHPSIGGAAGFVQYCLRRGYLVTA